MADIKPFPTIQIREYHALLTQNGEDDPTAIILHNTLEGTPIWTRDGEGSYVITLEGQFPNGKCGIHCTGFSSRMMMSGS